MKTLKFQEFNENFKDKIRNAGSKAVARKWDVEEWYEGRNGVRKKLGVRAKKLDYSVARKKAAQLRQKYKDKFFRIVPSKGFEAIDTKKVKGAELKTHRSRGWVGGNV